MSLQYMNFSPSALYFYHKVSCSYTVTTEGDNTSLFPDIDVCCSFIGSQDLKNCGFI